MSKRTNNGVEQYDENVVVVSNITDLPFTYIPYHSYERARVNHPNDVLYIFEGRLPGYKIVAFPILMNKPEEKVDD